jgi:DNA-binding transcriptional ArsR family regulator
MSITELTAGTEVTRQAVTKHLHVMEEAGLVRFTREGRASMWRLEQPRLEDARRHLEMISSQWDRTLDRLRKHVEE